MILSALPFLSAFQIPNLPAASVTLISGGITAAVFCCSGIDGQKPAPAGSALLGSVSYTQSFIQIRAEHTHNAVLVDYLRYDKDKNPEKPWFYSANAQDDSLIPISKEKFESVQAKYIPMELEMLPLSDYKQP